MQTTAFSFSYLTLLLNNSISTACLFIKSNLSITLFLRLHCKIYCRWRYNAVSDPGREVGIQLIQCLLPASPFLPACDTLIAVVTASPISGLCWVWIYQAEQPEKTMRIATKGYSSTDVGQRVRPCQSRKTFSVNSIDIRLVTVQPLRLQV
ncbi:hypothetical protein CPB84DRAFT_659630 [Gymnopilus junonius]|uniref:Uncharacterized protein n=1 Tax=Gymnopilus junonius TaxID=109634 RepID=A0A9P5TF21_GYMJU|nr:hypothetical protein CPB84DRAFT_659630 [Gymnopilus junonius]